MKSALLAAMYVICMVVVVPVVGYTLVSTKTGFLRLSEALAYYFPAHLLDGWLVVVGLPNWQTPTAVAAFAVTATFALLGVYMYSQGESGDKDQLFGPAASGTNEQGSAKLYTDERLLLEITRTWDGSWEEGHAVPGGGIVLGFNRSKGLYYVSPPEQHTFTFGMPGSGKTTAIGYESLDSLMACPSVSVVTSDPKGELYDATGAEIRAKLYERYGEDRVHVLDFRNTLRSESYNPMDHVWNTYEGYKRSADEHMEKALAYIKGETCVDAAHPDRTESWTSEEDHAAYMHELRYGHADKVLAWSKAEEAALDLAAAIIPEVPGSPGEHWETTARMALRAVILLVGTATDEDFDSDGEPVTAPLREQRTLESVKRIFDNYGARNILGQSPLVDLVDRLDPEHPAVSAIAQLRNSSDRDYGTTIAETIKFLDEYLGMAVNQIMNKSDFDLASFGTKQQILYVVLPDDRPVVGKAFSILVTQMYQALVAKALETGKTLPVQVTFLMEEFGNLKVQVPDFANKLAMSRGYGIFFSIVLQGDKQLAERYGEHGLDDIIDKCGTRILLQTNDVAGVGKYFSEAMGVYTVTSSSTSRHRKTLGIVDDSANRSNSQAQRPIMYPDEVCKWNPKWGAIVLQQKPGKEPTRKAMRLGYRTMQPCVYPLVQAWETPTGKNLNIGDRDQMQRKAALMEAESRLDKRIPNIPWTPTATHEERASLVRSLKQGGLSSNAKASLHRYTKRQAEKARACELILETDALSAVGERFSDEDISEIIAEAKFLADEREAFLLNDYQAEGAGDRDYAEKVRSRTRQDKDAVARVLWTFAAEAMSEKDGGTRLRALLEQGVKGDRPEEETLREEEGRKACTEEGCPGKPSGGTHKGARKPRSASNEDEIAEALASDPEVERVARDKSASRQTKRSVAAAKKKDGSWLDDLRVAARSCLDQAGSSEEYTSLLLEAGVEVELTKSGKDLLYKTASGKATGEKVGVLFTKSMVEHRLDGAPAPKAAPKRDLGKSMRVVLAKNGFDMEALEADMAKAGVTFEAVVEADPDLARWDEKANRYDCNWRGVLKMLARDHKVLAMMKADKAS